MIADYQNDIVKFKVLIDLSVKDYYELCNLLECQTVAFDGYSDVKKNVILDTVHRDGFLSNRWSEHNQSKFRDRNLSLPETIEQVRILFSEENVKKLMDQQRSKMIKSINVR